MRISTNAPRLPAVAPRLSRSHGFSLMELLVALTLTATVLAIMLPAFDVNSNIAGSQMQLAELQQSGRASLQEMVRTSRMAGRGGLATAFSVLTDQNVAASTTIGSGGNTENVLEDTDILTVRGVFETPIFQVDQNSTTSFVKGATSATLLIDSVTRTGFCQDLQAFKNLKADMMAGVEAQPIILISATSDLVYAVVEVSQIDVAAQVMDVDHTCSLEERATLTLDTAGGGGGGSHAGDYLALSSGGAFPTNLNRVLYAGLLEEYRYYIREDFNIPGDNTSGLRPKLSRARMSPNTDAPLPGDLAVDIADNILDLQIALGIDLDGNGRVDVEDSGGAALATSADEWLYNDENDDLALSWTSSPLQHVRLNILARTEGPDRNHFSPAIAQIEDRDYSEAASVGAGDEMLQRRFRRRILSSTVELRNL